MFEYQLDSGFLHTSPELSKAQYKAQRSGQSVVKSSGLGLVFQHLQLFQRKQPQERWCNPSPKLPKNLEKLQDEATKLHTETSMVRQSFRQQRPQQITRHKPSFLGGKIGKKNKPPRPERLPPNLESRHNLRKLMISGEAFSPRQWQRNRRDRCYKMCIYIYVIIIM